MESRYLKRILNQDKTIPSWIKEKSFIREVILHPLYLNRILRKNNPLTIDSISNVSLSNLYGAISFTLLDARLDNDLDSSLNRTDLYQYCRDKYLLSLKKIDSRSDWHSWLMRMEKIQGAKGKITEQRVIDRSQPTFKAFLSTAKIRDTKILESLDCYLLAKQYNDDAVDFIDDWENRRMTLLTSRVSGKGDPYEEFVKIILPSCIKRIEALLMISEKYLSGFPPIILFRRAILNYYKMHKSLNAGGFGEI